ncbi:hypothetical protein [Phyllobacterium endophyticum]|uniref:hypothetical protein n=1 Tax=Phyllobacterium endophyticum TaxID=1149773 RepID=UPI001475EADB|nr:hypothetical protein [Phyllobacterium endophyticum]MBB3235302.1 hypothetical protein [Phyllobacterium endophyticum]
MQRHPARPAFGPECLVRIAGGTMFELARPIAGNPGGLSGSVVIELLRLVLLGKDGF